MVRFGAVIGAWIMAPKQPRHEGMRRFRVVLNGMGRYNAHGSGFPDLVWLSAKRNSPGQCVPLAGVRF